MPTLTDAAIVEERKHLLWNGNHHSIDEEHQEDVEDGDVETPDNAKEKVPICCSYRLMVIICCTLSMTITFAAQASMSSAMVCMIENTDSFGSVQDSIGNMTTLNISFDSFNLTAANGTKRNEWTYSWDKETQGYIISSLFMGYYVSQLPSSIASARFGPTRVVTVSLILVSTFQVLAVPAARYGVGWLYADRTIVGIIDGFLYAPTFALVGQWAPRYETSLLFGIVGMGMELGNTMSYGVSLLSCEIDIQGGWPFVFYILSGIGFITALLFLIFVSDSPFNNRLISAKEVNYIASTIPKVEKNSKKTLTQIPVKDILKSMSVWAIVVSQIASDWLYYFFITMGPNFLKDVIKLSNFEVNLLSGIPFLGIIPTIYIAGFVCDKLVTNGIVTNTNVRKINDFICKIVPAIALIGLGLLPEGSAAAAFVLNTLGATFLGFCYVSWMANPVDLAPAYTGFIVGVCEVGAIWVAIVVPIVCEDITENGSRSEWQLMFYITGGIQVVCFIFYAVFASGELQPWALSTYKHAYEDLDAADGKPDVKKFQNGMHAISGSSDSISRRKKQIKEDETQTFITSLTLSLGGFQGTSSYEEEVKRRDNSYRMPNGQAETAPSIHIIESADNGHLLQTGQPHLVHQLDTATGSDDESWKQIAHGNRSPKPKNPVKFGRGDYTIESNSSPSTSPSSSLASATFDDAAISSSELRNLKNLADELAEALSVHSHQGLSNDQDSRNIDSNKDENVESHPKRNGNPANLKKESTRGTHSFSGVVRLSNGKLVSTRNNKHTEDSSENWPILNAGEAHNIPKGPYKEPHLMDNDSSSIMVPSAEFSDPPQEEQNERSGKRNLPGEQFYKSGKDRGNLSSLVKRLFALGKSKSNPNISFPNEETNVTLTDDDVAFSNNNTAWITKSFDTAKPTARNGNATQDGRRGRKSGERYANENVGDEKTLFAQENLKRYN